MTEITANDIGRDWTTPVPSALRMLINDEDMAWNPEFPSYSTDTQVQMLDQYGSTIYFSGQFYFQMSIVVGNGELYSVEEGASRTQVGGHGAWHYHFTYTRDGNDPGDWSPLLQGEVQVGAATLVVFGRIILRNAAGEEMPVV